METANLRLILANGELKGIGPKPEGGPHQKGAGRMGKKKIKSARTASAIAIIPQTVSLAKINVN